MDFLGRIRSRAEDRRRGTYLAERIGKTLCFSQHDMTADNGSGATVRADYNLALKALASLSSGATAPATTFAYQPWADTTSGLLKQRNAANTSWLVRDSLAEAFVTSRSSNTILAASDYKKPFVATSSFTQTLTAAATLGDGWFVPYRVDSGATVTFDPNSSENIDGATTKVVVGPAAGIIVCSGTAFFTYGFDNPVASDTVAGVIEIATQAEQETGTDTTRAVTPGRQHYHPSAVKFWARVDVSGGVPSVAADYGVSSITDNGAGDYAVNFDTAFSSASWAPWAIDDSGAGGGNGRVAQIATINAGSVRIVIEDPATPGSYTDTTTFYCGGAGDQ